MVEVVGNIDNLQSAIDFYLNITSVDGVYDSPYTRDRFFAMFEKEDSYRKENFLVYQELITEDYRIAEDAEPELEGEECLFDGSISYFSSKNEIEEPVVEEVEVIEEIEDEWVAFDEEEEYDDLGDDFIDAEDDEFVTPDVIEIKQDIKSDSTDGEEFTEWVYEEEQDDEEAFVSWGDEDGSEEDSEESFDEDEPDREFDFDNWGIDEEDEPEVVEEQEIVEEPLWDSEEDFWEDEEISTEGIGVYKENLVKEDNKVEVKNTVVDVITNNSCDNIENVPSDLREFVKMHPNCELSVVYKYYSKKEVEKQLRLGRVFKRKNKLLI